MAWFKNGDRNTKFFNAQVNRRRKRLHLKSIQTMMELGLRMRRPWQMLSCSSFKNNFVKT